MKKIDKIRAIKFQPKFQAPRGDVYGCAEYDIRKVRRMNRDLVAEKLLDMTLKLYPFAIFEGDIYFFPNGSMAQVYVTLPLSPALRVSPVSKEE